MSYHARTQNYEFTGDMHGMVSLTANIFGGGYFLDSYGRGRIDVANVLRFDWAFLSNDHGGAGQRIPMQLFLTWTGGLLASTTNDSDTVYVIDVAAGPALETLDGTYSVVFPVSWEEIDVTDGASVALTDPNLCDTLPFNRHVDARMVVKVGSVITATCSYGGATVTGTATAISDFDLTVETIPDVFANYSFADAFMQVLPYIGGIGQTTPGGSYSTTGRSAAWGATVEAQANGATSGTARCRYILSTLLQYNWECRINAWDQPYPGSLDVEVTIGADPSLVPITQVVTVSGGTGSLFIEQKSYAIDVEFDGSGVYSDAVTDIWPVSAVLTSASLAAAGEDTDLAYRPLWMSGWIWDGVSIDQEASLDALTGSWSATGSGGSISVPASSFDSRLRGSSWNGVSLAGYGFTELELTADAAGLSARVNFDAKYWDVTVGLTGTVMIDLANPNSSHADTDETNTIYPLTGTGPYSAQEGWSTGVHNATGLVIDHLASGHTYTLTKVTLLRRDHARLTFLDAFKGWEQATSNTVAGVTTTTYYRQAHTCDTDGMPSLHQTDATWINSTSGGGSDTISTASIADFADNVEGNSGAFPDNGFTCAPLTPNDSSSNLRDGLLNDERESALLMPGLYWDGSAWQTGIDKAVGATVPAIFLFNSIVAYPGAGDLWGWGGGALGAPVDLKARIVLRGQAWGLTIATGGARRSGIVVSAKDHTSLAAEGSGTSDTYGEFRTGTPWIPGETSADVSAAFSSPVSSLNQPFATRRRNRFAFQGVPAGATGLSYDVGPQQRHYRAYCLSGDIWIGAGTGVPIAWNDINSGLSGTSPCIRVEQKSQSAKVWLWYVDGSGDVQMASTRDDGGSWQEMADVGAGSRVGAFAARGLSIRYVYRIVSGAILGIIYDAQGSIAVPEFTAVPSGVDDNDIAADEYISGQGAWTANLFYYSSGVLTMLSSPDGINFS